jgi:hypothetical protein
VYCVVHSVNCLLLVRLLVAGDLGLESVGRGWSGAVLCCTVHSVLCSAVQCILHCVARWNMPGAPIGIRGAAIRPGGGGGVL